MGRFRCITRKNNGCACACEYGWVGVAALLEKLVCERVVRWV